MFWHPGLLQEGRSDLTESKCGDNSEGRQGNGFQPVLPNYGRIEIIAFGSITQCPSDRPQSWITGLLRKAPPPHTTQAKFHVPAEL